ncbi:hypothetical protein Tco_1151536 [Tanacetum coccineum]
MCTYLKNMEGKKSKDLKNKSINSIQKMFDRAFKRVNTFVDFRIDLVKGSSKRARTKLEQDVTKKQKVDDVQGTAEVDDVQETVKVDDDQKAAFLMKRKADGSSKMYLVFSHMLKSFDMEDLETLWKLVKAKYGSTRPAEDLDLIIWGDLKTMFEPHVKDKGRIVGIKSFLMWFGITAVLIDVNVAQSMLLLVEKVTTARESYYS